MLTLDVVNTILAIIIFIIVHLLLVHVVDGLSHQDQQTTLDGSYTDTDHIKPVGDNGTSTTEVSTETKDTCRFDDNDFADIESILKQCTTNP
jgi:hypothetical protein